VLQYLLGFSAHARDGRPATVRTVAGREIGAVPVLSGWYELGFEGSVAASGRS
jgi:hypothetical protein